MIKSVAKVTTTTTTTTTVRITTITRALIDE